MPGCEDWRAATYGAGRVRRVDRHADDVLPLGSDYAAK
jgi:hypothetical protein